MKPVKILFHLVAILMAFSGLTGCKKFLDRKPLQGTLDDFGIEQQTMGLYRITRDYVAFNSLPWIDFHSIRDDDATKGSSATDGAEIVAEFETFQYTKDDWATNEYWNNHFLLINQANNILQTAELAGFTDELSHRNVGEAKFFRAYCYFDLVRAYGEVPLFTTYNATPQDAVKPKASVDSIFAVIEKDLQEAAAALPLTWDLGSDEFPGRLTSGAANTLLAQVYIFRSNWAGASAACDAVIASGQYSLPAFREIWRDGPGGAGKNGPESIYEIQTHVGTGGSPNYGAPYAQSQNPRIIDGGPKEWDLGWGWNAPSEKLETDWSNSDPRKKKTILYSGQHDGGDAEGGYGLTLPAYPTVLVQKYWNKKVYADPAQRAITGAQATWINHRILRYADVILMKAEAANELGDGATAATMLEMIRSRARGGNNAVLPPIAFAGKDQMRAAIKNERRWEFAMEGLRFYDLVRWGDAEAVLGPLGYTSRCKYYPIPQKAIDLTGDVLVQNPEW
ncbi:RagB/SusD family nutrient uptake outer membrane protein [Terrimonas alba]|uniref:RagB/SusD family nutrient uptake outer membrane protein n=1 Tax=Terrimonas alba TaxID=3349636 RepID=UPI0035F3DD84